MKYSFFSVVAYTRRAMRFLASHKIATFIGIILLVGGSYWEYGRLTSTAGVTRYVLGTVTKGTVISSVTGSGQVAASDDATIKPKVAGDVTSILVTPGQHVGQGQALAYLDSASAQSAVTDAKIAVDQARVNLEHDTLQAPIDYQGLQDAVDRATRDQNNAYDDAYAALSDAFVKLPDVITGTESFLYNKDIDKTYQNISAYQNFFVTYNDDKQTLQPYAARAESDYLAARAAYTKGSAAFGVLSAASSKSDITNALAQTKAMAGLLATAAVSEVNLVATTIDLLGAHNWVVPPTVLSAQSTARTYVSSANTVLTNLTSAKKALDSATDALASAKHALDLASVGNPTGNNPFSLQVLQNTLKQKEAALVDAQQALADHAIRAPFSGTVATFVIRTGDSISTNEAVGTLISTQKMAELSLNEIDAAKVQLGDKATLTLDAIDNLTLTGTVAEIDSVGTISQGVVSYMVKISLDTQDVRIKPGMTVNATIQIAVHQDVLLVPTSAVKTQNGQSVVQIFEPALAATSDTAGVTSATPPQSVPVQVGISDDTSVEITSGLSEGQQIVTRTITSTAATPAASTQTRGIGGGGIRLGG